MSDTPPRQSSTPSTLVWDWPLRLWHWAFALSVTASLATGWIGDISLMDWHLRLGYLALGLLLFRLGWAIWGARYARLATFRPTPSRLLAHLRGRGAADPRTAPGAALVLLLVGLVATQAVAGLFTSDGIFTEGPLVRHASDGVVDAMSALHHRVFWGVGALIGVHLLAHLVYAWRRDPTPLSMFTGRKPARIDGAVAHLPGRALMTAAAAAAAVWLGLWLA
ncbi:MAG: cytochrome b/b6 domain-containing protein [Pseudomonadales bacterium]